MKEDYKALAEKRAKLKQPSKEAKEFGAKLVKAIVSNLNNPEKE